MTSSGAPSQMVGTVPGATPLARATRLAGALAEMSITRLELAPEGGAPRVLRARETDLPREIAAMQRGRLTPAGLEAAFIISPDHIEWTAFTAEAAGVLRASFA